MGFFLTRLKIEYMLTLASKPAAASYSSVNDLERFWQALLLCKTASRGVAVCRRRLCELMAAGADGLLVRYCTSSDRTIPRAA